MKVGGARKTVEFEYGRGGAKEREEDGKIERAWHLKDGKPENRETIQSAADAANCPLIIRSCGGTEGG